MKKPLALIIMDGFGTRPETDGNAIRAAKTPNLDRIFAENPRTDIGASGMDVGLPEPEAVHDDQSGRCLTHRIPRF